jgi:hypothetical protein
VNARIPLINAKTSNAENAVTTATVKVAKP